MDYTVLADELLNNMHLLHKAKFQKNINEAMQGEAFVLQYITHQKGDVLPGEIGNEMDVSSARIAAALNNLESKGLITRRIDLRDRRKILVGITPEGKVLAQQQQQAVIAGASKMLALLGEQDAREYVRITCKLAEILSAREGGNICCN